MKTHISRWLLALFLGVCPSAVVGQHSLLIPGDTEEIESTTDPTPDPSTHVESGSEPEVIRERYPDRAVRIERQVVQDENQNYINHGTWKMYDPQGNVVVEGHYQMNEKDGVWTRVFYQRDAELLSMPPFSEAQLPIVSQANFKDGELDGKWVIYDANKRQLCEWSFTEGKRDGISRWWFITGSGMREIHYTAGSIDGELKEWDRAGKLLVNDTYDDGRRLAKKIEYYHDKVKKSEGMVLYPRLVLEHPDNWLDCTLAKYTPEGKAEKHGKWVSWYENGQRKLEATYEHDLANGEFVWWHENGQKSLVASYKNGKKEGQWTWWHENGQKSIQGEYVNNDPSNKWFWWQDNGKVAKRADFSDPATKPMLADGQDQLPNATLPIRTPKIRH